MATPQSPATVLALLKRAKTGYQKKSPDAKSKAETRHKEIIKDLQRLRVMARQKASGANLAKPFAARKKLVLKKITEYRKLINTAKEKDADPNKAQLQTYTKALLKLTRVVFGLDYARATAAEEPASLDHIEEGDVGELDALDKVSDEELRALEAEDSAEIPEETEEGEGEGEQPTAPGSDLATAFTTRLKELLPELQKAKAAKSPAAEEMNLKLSEAQLLARKHDFAQAMKLLEQADALAKKALAGGGEGDGATASREWEAAKQAWRNASDTVDGQIAQLQTALRNSGDEDYRDIAEFGLNAVTGNFKVPLMASIRTIDSTEGEARKGAAAKAEQIVTRFKHHIDQDEVVMACDGNPLDVKVTIRDTLGAALAQMEKALKTVAAS
jgi:hypothetical protein